MQALKRATVAVALVALAVAGCNGGIGGAGNDPVSVVNEAMNAAESGGFSKLTEYACQANKDDIAAAFGTGDLGDLSAAGIDPNELFAAMKIDFQDMAVTPVSQSGNEATVHLKGKMAMTFDEAKIREVMKKVIEAQGMEATDEIIDSAMSMITAQLSQTQDIETDMKVLQENGKWVICE
jgi:predicted small secreted protein